MPKTLSSTEAKNKFGEMLDSVASNDEDIIIETHGKPKAVVITFPEYQKLLEYRMQLRRKEALRELDRLRADVRARNQDLTSEEAEQIADEVTRDAIDSLFKKGIVRYKE